MNDLSQLDLPQLTILRDDVISEIAGRSVSRQTPLAGPEVLLVSSEISNFGKMKPSREPDFLIGPPEDPYMLRWWIIPRNNTFNIYYHTIRHSDDDRALHDHPWPSFSIMAKGQLWERHSNGKRLVKVGDCVYRSPNFAHRLETIDGEEAETIFITGPILREWGFHCPKGWVAWKDFTKLDNNGGERGCGEMD